jgi:hypothetical protein
VFNFGKQALGRTPLGQITGIGQGQAQGSTLPSPTGPPVPDAQGGFLDNIFDTLKKEGPGLAVGALGQLLAPKVDAPDVSGITEGLRDRITGDALSPLFEQGAGEINRILDAPIDAPPEESFARGDSLILEQTAEDIKNLRNQFKALNPTADVENNSAFLAEKSKIEERSRERRAQVRDEISFQFEREQLQRRLQATQLALNLDSAQTEQLIRIAQADIEAIGIQFGLDQREAQEFKDLFSQFGGLLSQGQGA